jgi:hypothetical protein
MDIFDKQGRLIIPINQRGKIDEKGKKTKYAVTEAYCPNGCSIIDPEYPINGFPGLRIKFARPGMDGEFVISAIEGDFDKTLLSGSLEEGKKDELYCPHCGVLFAKLVSCNCSPGADMVVLGLTPHLDFNNAVTFCNVTGCHNGAFVKSGEVLRHLRL